MGDNTKASIITRGLAETARLGAALGADPSTLAGLAGLGDLVATCASPLSRNRTFGVNLGRGMQVADVVAATRQTAEGVKSCRSILELATQPRRRPAHRRGGRRRRRRARHPGPDGPCAARPAHASTSWPSPPRRARHAETSSRAAARSVPQVLDVLDADRQPQQRLRDAWRPRWRAGGGAPASTRPRRGSSRAPRAGRPRTSPRRRRLRALDATIAPKPDICAVARAWPGSSPARVPDRARPGAPASPAGASSAALAWPRSTRSGSVRSPRRASHASNGPGTAPASVRCRVQPRRAGRRRAVTTAPSTTSE